MIYLLGVLWSFTRHDSIPGFSELRGGLEKLEQRKLQLFEKNLTRRNQQHIQRGQKELERVARVEANQKQQLDGYQQDPSANGQNETNRKWMNAIISLAGVQEGQVGQLSSPRERLAVDKTGSLVNSWVEISIDRPTATPLSGKSVCKNDQMENCEIRGDGKGFSQSWVVEQSPTPKFDPSLPFSGLRYFEFSTRADGVKGRFYDPIVVINGQKELTFDLARTPQIRF